MIRAENDLFDAADRVDRLLAEADEQMTELGATTQPATAAEIEGLRAWATGPKAPPEWRAVVERVNAGELTWQEVANGKAMADPAVRAALDATTGTAVEVPETTAEPRPATPPPPARRRPAPEPDVEADDFSSHSYLRRR
jgi:hypothetical protein